MTCKILNRASFELLRPLRSISNHNDYVLDFGELGNPVRDMIEMGLYTVAPPRPLSRSFRPHA